MNSDIKNLKNYVITQTIACESFENSYEYVREQFKLVLSTKHKERFTNRKLKRQIEKKMATELREFDKVCKRYLEMNIKMLKHFDNWEHEQSLNNEVEKTYNFLDEKVYI